MNRSALAVPQLKARPESLRLRAPQSALAKHVELEGFDAGIKLAVNAEKGEIAILSEIGPSQWFGMETGMVDAPMVKEALDAMNDAPVTVLLNSPGGDAFEGVAMYNLLRQYKGRVTVRVLGLAASAASVVAMAGDRIEMGLGTTMMIHSAWALVVGNQADLREFADVLDSLDRSVADIYASRTGKKTKAVLELMQKETWMSSSEAVAENFADAETKDEKRKARAQMNAPATTVRAQVRGLYEPNSIRASLSAGAPLAATGIRLRAAAGPGAPTAGASASLSTLKETAMKKPIAEQIAALEARRAANLARVEAIQDAAAAAGSTKDTAEKEEFDSLIAQVETIDVELADLRKMEAIALRSARPAPQAPAVDRDEPVRTELRYGEGVRVRSNVAPGVPMVRAMKAQIFAKGIPQIAQQIVQANRQWMDETPEVEKVFMTAVAAGDTLTAGWASELVYPANVAAAFLEFLRPMTILGKVQGFTRVPFNVRWAGQTAAPVGYWVGQSKPIPTSKLTTTSDSLGIAKAAGMVVLNKELIMSSDPSAELLVRDQLAKSIAQFLDVHFIAPDYAAVANVNPASITNSVEPTAASGTAATNFLQDTQTLFTTFDVNNLEGGGFFWVTTPKIARAISLMRTSLGEPLYPTVTPEGGTYLGYPLIVSGSAMQVGSPVTGEGNLLVLGHAPSIAMADEGGIAIDASEEASIQMLDNPTNAGDSGTTPTSVVSMWQTGSVAIRAIRFINWSKRRSFAVAYIKDAAYVAA